MCAVGPDSPGRGKSAVSQTSSKVFCGVSPPGIVRLPDLDLLITLSEGRPEWELFIKPIHSGVHQPYKSSHVISSKRAVARNQFQRAKKNSSTAGRRRRGEKIAELLRLHSYSEEEIRAAMNRQARNGHGKNVTGVLKLLFVNDCLSRRVCDIVRKAKLDVNVVFHLTRH